MSLTGQQVLALIDKYELSNQNSTNLADGSYLVEKLTDKHRIMWRKKKGEKCTPVTSDKDEIPKGSQSFTFAECRVYTKDYEAKQEIMVPSVFISASAKSVFPIAVNKGYVTFDDRPLQKEAIESFLSDEIPA